MAAPQREGSLDLPHLTTTATQPDPTLSLPPLPTTKPIQPSSTTPVPLHRLHSSYLTLYRPLTSVKDRCILAAAIILALAAGAPLPIIGVIFGKIINSFPPTADEINTRIGQLLGVAVAYFFITWGWATAWGMIGERVARGLRVRLLQRAVGMEVGWWDSESLDVRTTHTLLCLHYSQSSQLDRASPYGRHANHPTRHFRKGWSLPSIRCLLSRGIYHRFYSQCSPYGNPFCRRCSCNVFGRLWRF
jgi:hypothetical protein